MNLKEKTVFIIEQLTQISNRYYRYSPYLSLLLGVLTVVFWQRGFLFIRWVFIYLIFIGITTIVISRLAKNLPQENKVLSISVWCIEFINQNLYQDLILFLLPIYYQSSTLFSANIVFVVVIAILSIITTFDNVYRRLILRSKAAQFLFYTFNLFAFINFAMPVLFGIRNIYSLYLSISLSVLFLAPLFVDYREIFRRSKAAVIAGVVLISIAAINLSKGFIPPVPLKLVSGTASIDIDRIKKEPIKPLENISSKGLETIYCYTSIFAPMGIHETLWHVWKKDGATMQKVSLEITGGRKEGYRTWSKKAVDKNNTKGKWTVDVLTDGGQLIGRVRFEII